MANRQRPSTGYSPAKSPKKQRQSAYVAPTTYDYEQALNDQQHQMSMQISDKEIEIERLKTTVVALNGKCANTEDQLEDVKNATNRFVDSEHNRTKLQEDIIITATNVQQNSEEHKLYQSELIA